MSEFSAEELALLEGIKSIGREPSPELAAGETEAAPEKRAVKTKEEKAREAEQLRIYDAIITKKYYEETFKVGKKIGGTWRSRTAGQANVIAKMIDSLSFTTNLAVNNYLNTFNMAYSLVIFNGQDLTSKSISERVNMLETLPEVLLAAMSRSLVEFDQKVLEAVEVGLENF